MLTLLSFALAAEAAPCPAPTTTDTLLVDLDAAKALTDTNDKAAGDAASRLVADLTCLGESVPAQLLGQTYRSIAAAALTGGDESTARRWFNASYSADPTGYLDVPQDHPAVALYEAIRSEGQPAAFTDASHKLAEGAWTLDGRSLTSLTAREGMPHLLQLKAADGVQSWLVDGAAFPADALAKADAVAKADDCPPLRPHKRYASPGQKFDLNGDCKADPVPLRPGEKLPLKIAGLALLAGAGGLYAEATLAHGQFEAASLLSDVERYKSLTNQMVVLSGATAIVGLSALTWGVVVSDQGTVLPRISGRF